MGDSLKFPRWTVCQLGAREHYSIARALSARGLLDRLITDLWLQPKNPLGVLNRRLRDRFHPDLSGETVHSCNFGSLASEALLRLKGAQDWNVVIHRNERFASRVVDALKTLKNSGANPNTQRILYSYSYTALPAFQWAKANGWKTVLGQIDGAIVEDELVHRLQQSVNLGANRPPSQYWANWRSECRLADHIIVNSDWSKQLLEEAGIDRRKINVIPLAYAAPSVASTFERNYPDRFSHSRPLRVLFLGQIGYRKGAVEMIRAARLLNDLPIEFWLVGPVTMPVSCGNLTESNIRWIGSVPRSTTASYYRDADLLLFPTHSDGFGITQLEAQAWKLPLVVSKHCARVAKDGVNGVVLDKVNPQTIAEALIGFLEQPERLRDFSEKHDNLESYSLERISSSLLSLDFLYTGASGAKS